ncbi:hypothetical protein [Peribacillus muralis]|uniref:hypothetical protein n=1 Tax=Peribacillus muralis TaxID=264697 RepID=UPI003D088752
MGDKASIVDTKSIEPSHLFEDIGFGSIIDYEVINKNLMVRVSGQITPGMFVGDIIITYEYRDKMYQAKAIEFITDIKKTFLWSIETLSRPPFGGLLNVRSFTLSYFQKEVRNP